MDDDQIIARGGTEEDIKAFAEANGATDPFDDEVDFYKTPDAKIFNDIKKQSIALWKARYSDEFGYVTEKVQRINEIENYKDNWGSIFGMFDHQNQGLLMGMIQPETRTFLNNRIYSNDGGSCGSR